MERPISVLRPWSAHLSLLCLARTSRWLCSLIISSQNDHSNVEDALLPKVVQFVVRIISTSLELRKLILSFKNYCLLHADRQAGKSSLQLPMCEALDKQDHVVLNTALQGIGTHKIFRTSLFELIDIVYPVRGHLVFDNAAGFK